MEAFVTRGYSWIDWIQGFRSPALDVLFAGLSLLGDEPFYLVLLPVVYWTMSRRAGLRLALLVLASAWLNAALKGLLDLPRPSPERVTVLEILTTGGAPSGHAQNAVVVWGYLAWVWTGLWRGSTGRGEPPSGSTGSAARAAPSDPTEAPAYAAPSGSTESQARAAPSGSTEARAHTSPPLLPGPWVFLGAALLVGAIGASRVYRGVHFPVDVALGWAVGVVALTIFLAALRPLEDWLVRRGAATLAMLSAAAVLGMLVLHREGGALAAAATFLGVATGAV